MLCYQRAARRAWPCHASEQTLTAILGDGLPRSHPSRCAARVSPAATAFSPSPSLSPWSPSSPHLDSHSARAGAGGLAASLEPVFSLLRRLPVTRLASTAPLSLAGVRFHKRGSHAHFKLNFLPFLHNFPLAQPISNALLAQKPLPPPDSQIMVDFDSLVRKTNKVH